MNKRALGIVVVFLFAASASLLAGSFNATSDFSGVNNPSGSWSYGYSSSGGSSVTLLPISFNNGGWQEGWTTNSGFPAVYINYSGSDVISGTVDVPTNVVQMHPASDGTNAVVEFTAPSTGTFTITGQFQGDDTAGTSTNVGIYLNQVALFTGEVTGYYPNGGSAIVPFSLSEVLNAGDTLDFSVGFGTDSSYLFDSTGLIANINGGGPSPVPEPASALLMATGIAGLLCGLRRRTHGRLAASRRQS
jgi:hypothetical protein